MSDSVRQHLERFVFEVYGAEEGQRKLDELIKKEEEHAKSMKGLGEAAKKAAKDEADAAKEAADAQKKRAQDTEEALKKTGAAFAALVALAVDASADLEASTGRVSRQLEKAGLSHLEVEKAMRASREEAKRLGIGYLDADAALGKLVGATKDGAKASTDFKLALDIQATGQLNLKETTELLTRTRKGEIAELIKLDGFNRDNIKALEEIEDRTTRAEIAMRMLVKEYSGAGTTLVGTRDHLNSIKETGRELLAILGDSGTGLINAWGELFGVIGGGETVLGQFASGFNNFKNQAGKLSEFVTEFAQRKASGDIPLSMSIGEFRDLYNLEQGNAALESRLNNFAPGMGIVDDPYANDSGVAYGKGATPKGKTKKKKRGSGRKREGGSFVTLEEATAFSGDFLSQGEVEEMKAQQDEWARLQEERTKRLEEETKKRIDAENAYFDNLFKSIEESTKRSEQAAKQRAAIERAKIDAIMDGVDAVGASAAKLAKNEKASLAIEAGSAAVRALVAHALAITPPPLGGPHFLPGAIAQTGAAAAMAAEAGVAIATPSKVASKSSAPPPSEGSSSLTSQERADADLANSGVSLSTGLQPLVIQYHTLWPPSPQQVKDTRRMLESDTRADV